MQAGHVPITCLRCQHHGKSFKALHSSHTQTLCHSAIFSWLHEDKQGPGLVISGVVLSICSLLLLWKSKWPRMPLEKSKEQTKVFCEAAVTFPGPTLTGWDSYFRGCTPVRGLYRDSSLCAASRWSSRSHFDLGFLRKYERSAGSGTLKIQWLLWTQHPSQCQDHFWACHCYTIWQKLWNLGCRFNLRD